MSRLVFGTGGRFGRLQPALAQLLVDFSWSSGIRIFDTGFYYSRGLSQARLLSSLGDRLEHPECIVTTKVKPDPLLAEYAISQTLSSLPNGCIDVCFLWGGGVHQLNDPLLSALMSSMLASGKVKRFGLNTHDLSLMNVIPDLQCFRFLSDVMIDFSLAQRDRSSFISFIKARGIRVWAGTALAQGFLLESIFNQFLRTRSVSYLARSFLNSPTRHLYSRASPIRRMMRSSFSSSYKNLPLAFVLNNRLVDFVPVGMMSRSSINANLFIERNLHLFASDLIRLERELDI